MLTIKNFADHLHPLRCSKIPQFMLCSLKAVMEFLEAEHREGRSAAQTGTAVHLAIATWHKNGRAAKAALNKMKEARDEYPMANLVDAAELFRLYTEDERNHACEVSQVEMFLPAQEIEEGIFIEGTLDQIRDGSVWDVKTGRGTGDETLRSHTYQLAAYTVMASRALHVDVRPGGLIMVRDYLKKRGQVFYPIELSLDDCKNLLHSVCDRVRQVRRGEIALVPNENCQYCVGVPTCVTKLRGL